MNIRIRMKSSIRGYSILMYLSLSFLLPLSLTLSPLTLSSLSLSLPSSPRLSLPHSSSPSLSISLSLPLSHYVCLSITLWNGLITPTCTCKTASIHRWKKSIRGESHLVCLSYFPYWRASILIPCTNVTFYLCLKP